MIGRQDQLVRKNVQLISIVAFFVHQIVTVCVWLFAFYFVVLCSCSFYLLKRARTTNAGVLVIQIIS